MEKEVTYEYKKCPRCGREDMQRKNGHNASGTQKCICGHCKKMYTLEPKGSG